MARDIKGQQVKQTGVRGEVNVHPLPSILPGDRGGAWTIIERPEAPCTDLVGKVMAIDPSDTPAGRRGRFHEFHHATYTDNQEWMDALASGTINPTVMQKCDDAHIQIRAGASGFEGYGERIYRAADFAASVVGGSNPERLGLSLVAMIGTADFQPMLDTVVDVAKYGEAEGKLTQDMARRYINGAELAKKVQAVFLRAQADHGLNTSKTIEIAKAVSLRLAESEKDDGPDFTPEPQRAQADDDDVEQDREQATPQDKDWTEPQENMPPERQDEDLQAAPQEDDDEDDHEDLDDEDVDQGPTEAPEPDNCDDEDEDPSTPEPTEVPENPQPETPDQDNDPDEAEADGATEAPATTDDDTDDEGDTEDDEDDDDCPPEADSGSSSQSPEQVEDPSKQIDLDEAEDFLAEGASEYTGEGWDAHGINAQALEAGIPDLTDLTTKEQQVADKALRAIIDGISLDVRAASGYGYRKDAKASTMSAYEPPAIGEDIWQAGRWFSFCQVTGKTIECQDRAEAAKLSHQQREDIKTSRQLAEIRNERTLSMAWGDMVIQRVELPKRWPGQWKKQRPSFSDSGCVPQAMHRLCIDGKVFTDSARRAGRPTIVVDLSGSMSLSTEQIESVARAHPYATIAVYSGASLTGVLRIIVDRGNVAKNCYFSSPGGGQNTIDGPALRWLAQQSAPRIWVSDGGIFGASGRGGAHSADNINADVRDTLRTFKIKQLADPDSVTPYLKECSQKGKVFLRRPRKVKDEAVEGSLTPDEILNRENYYSQYNDEGPAY